MWPLHGKQHTRVTKHDVIVQKLQVDFGVADESRIMSLSRKSSCHCRGRRGRVQHVSWRCPRYFFPLHISPSFISCFLICKNQWCLFVLGNVGLRTHWSVFWTCSQTHTHEMHLFMHTQTPILPQKSTQSPHPDTHINSNYIIIVCDKKERVGDEHVSVCLQSDAAGFQWDCVL